MDDKQRIAPTRRPRGRAIGHHHWSDLLFVHWRVRPDVIAPLLPRELTLDTWEGDAWVGLVPFHMSGVRPWWSPPVPGISAFHETNVRTYVYHKDQGPGVWFFSLEASSSLAVCVARWRWSLPYFRSTMHLRRHWDNVTYRSTRRWPRPAGAHIDIEATLGPLLGEGEANRPLPPGQAIPGALEFFLVERYLIYGRSLRRGLLCGQVHHNAYPLREAELVKCDESLLAAAGVNAGGPPCHALYSSGVQVEIFPLRPAPA